MSLVFQKLLFVAFCVVKVNVYLIFLDQISTECEINNFHVRDQDDNELIPNGVLCSWYV